MLQTLLIYTCLFLCISLGPPTNFQSRYTAHQPADDLATSRSQSNSVVYDITIHNHGNSTAESSGDAEFEVSIWTSGGYSPAVTISMTSPHRTVLAIRLTRLTSSFRYNLATATYNHIPYRNGHYIKANSQIQLVLCRKTRYVEQSTLSLFLVRS